MTKVLWSCDGVEWRGVSDTGAVLVAGSFERAVQIGAALDVEAEIVQDAG